MSVHVPKTKLSYIQEKKKGHVITKANKRSNVFRAYKLLWTVSVILRELAEGCLIS